MHGVKAMTTIQDLHATLERKNNRLLRVFWYTQQFFVQLVAQTLTIAKCTTLRNVKTQV